MYYKTYYVSPIGQLVIVSDEESIVGLWLLGQKYFLATLEEDPISNDELPILKQAKAWLDRYFNAQQPSIKELKLAPKGSKFRKKVWKHLSEIPYGEVITYGEIANKVAKEMGVTSMSAQAVGNAVGHNPISIIIPCHRVVGTNGSLTGYAGGIDNKIKLLKLEQVDIEQFYKPKSGTAL